MVAVRVGMLGDRGVGKTALAFRYHHGNINDETYDPTSSEAQRKKIIVDNEAFFVEVIDTINQEQYATLRDEIIKECHCFALVYSVTSRSTFDSLRAHRAAVLRCKRCWPISIVVGNNYDKTYEREVSKKEGMTLARSFGCEFIETSAETGFNVDSLFTILVQNLRNQLREKTQASNRPPQKQSHNCIVV